MKTKKDKILFTISIVLLLLVSKGCDAVSRKGSIVNEIELEVFWRTANPNTSWGIDNWAVDDGDKGMDIDSASFGIVVRAKAPGDEYISGIKMIAEIDDHFDPWGSGKDIWDANAPNGKPYGFVKVFPEESSKWDFGESRASGIIAPNKEVVFFFGLGNPESVRDEGYRWPSGCNDAVQTVLRIKFYLWKTPGTKTDDAFAYCSFLRAQCAGMWWPMGEGVCWVSVSGVGEYQPLEINLNDEIIPLEAPGYPPVSSYPNDVGFPPRTKETITYPNFSAEGWSDCNLCFLKLKYDLWDGWCDWRLDPVPVSIPAPDINDLNDCMTVLSASEPYMFFKDLWFDDPNYLIPYNYTAFLSSFDESNNVIVTIPIKMYLHDFYGDDRVKLQTEYIVPVTDSRFADGLRCQDFWEISGIFIYMPENGHLELDPAEPKSDFNFDCVVNHKDYGILISRWEKGIFDPNFYLNWDLNLDGKITMEDLGEFAEGWLQER